MAETTYTQAAYLQAPYARGNPAVPQGSAAGAGAGSVEPERAGASGIVNILGALMSLALLVGVAVWGYRLLSRDVSGLPVVRALEGPMRVQPDDPGGQQADHQGLAVNAIAAHGSAAPTADRLVLAPQPVALVDEDSPGRTQDAGRVASSGSGAAEDAASGEGQKGLSPKIAALVDQLTAQGSEAGSAPDSAPEVPTQVALIAPETLTEPQSEGPATSDEKPVDEAGEAPVETEATPEIVAGPGLARSLRPVARPERSAASASATPDATPASLDVDPASLPVGTRLAQLGAYDSAEVARVEWDRLHTRFIDYMDGKQRVIQQATSGGRTFYRLRAMGFADLSDARRFCAVLVAEKADCIPVTTR